jgi:pimeloyl-ACP methyl ester carboxylesterase
MDSLLEQNESAAAGVELPTDEELARSLPGDFRSEYADVNGTRLHYVAGGQGEPVVLLPAWPETWWQYRKIMPALARRHRVIVVEVRGMGGSARPTGGFDKKNMARDVHELVGSLGYDSVNVVGHDIGAMVAFSFAANHGAATRRLALLDVLHPDDSRYEMPLLPRPGTGFNMWWWAFNQVTELPEKLIVGRLGHLIEWLFDNSLVHPDAITPHDRAIYARAYDGVASIRASNGWYQAFHQDIADMRTYGTLAMPVLGLASHVSHDRFTRVLPTLADDARVVKVENSSHWVVEEQPELIARELLRFFA